MSSSSISTANVSLSAPVQVPDSATKVVVTGGPSGLSAHRADQTRSPGVVPERTSPPSPSVTLVSSGVCGVHTGGVGLVLSSSVSIDNVGLVGLGVGFLGGRQRGLANVNKYCC